MSTSASAKVADASQRQRIALRPEAGDHAIGATRQ